MNSLFQFNEEEIVTFFAVLIRFSILLAVLPITGDRMVPAPVKVLLGLGVTACLFPALVRNGLVNPALSSVWAARASSLAGTVAIEIITALLLGFVARLAFDVLQFGGNAVGTFMGFASASLYDPHQETQSQVVAEIQVALAMLVFLAVDGHHLMLRAALGSFELVGLGQAQFNGEVMKRLIELSGGVLKYGIQLSAPVAISLFAVNVAFGVMSKAMPQINVLVLSFAVSAMVGLVVLFISLPQFQSAAANVLSRSGEWMQWVAQSLGRR